jgi:RecA/RadA recombinase
MAVMVPAGIAGDVSPGERDIFRRLKNATDIEGWIVLHSLDIARHRRQVSGEIDFVIIIPELGVLCLEVKACRSLRRESGSWYYGRETKPDRRGPFKQASEAMHSLRQRVVERRPDLSRVVFWSAVVFPYVPLTGTSEEWHDWQLIDNRTYRHTPLPQLLSTVLQKARLHLAQCQTARWFAPNSQEPNQEQCQTLLDLLRPNFEHFESPTSRSKRLHDEVKHYTNEQLVALDAMEANERVIFSGPAGTGKTFLAVEAARRSANKGERVLLLCFNSLLGEWLGTQTEGLPSSVTVTTLHSFLLKQSGGLSVRKDSEFWNNELPNTVSERLLNRDDPVLFDTLIVDEAQDICRTIYLDILDLILDGGLASGSWQFFGDFERQAIYHDSSQPPKNVLTQRSGPAPVYTLRVNCRNPPRVAAFVTLLGAVSPEYSRVLRPDARIEPVQHYYTNDAEQIQLLTDTLQEAYAEGFKGGSIVVLSPFIEGCATRISASPWKERLIPFRGDAGAGYVKYCTVHAFKGLEAAFVIMTDVQKVEQSAARDLFYVGITRTLQRIVMLADQQAKKDIVNLLTKIGGA